jgi:hypothetical protein
VCRFVVTDSNAVHHGLATESADFDNEFHRGFGVSVSEVVRGVGVPLSRERLWVLRICLRFWTTSVPARQKLRRIKLTYPAFVAKSNEPEAYRQHAGVHGKSDSFVRVL